jgi:hypothetical protein
MPTPSLLLVYKHPETCFHLVAGVQLTISFHSFPTVYGPRIYIRGAGPAGLALARILVDFLLSVLAVLRCYHASIIGITLKSTYILASDIC